MREEDQRLLVEIAQHTAVEQQRRAGVEVFVSVPKQEQHRDARQGVEADRQVRRLVVDRDPPEGGGGGLKVTEATLECRGYPVNFLVVGLGLGALVLLGTHHIVFQIFLFHHPLASYL